MNQTQKNYAKKRIIEIRGLAIARIRSMKSMKFLTVMEVYEQVKNKKPSRPTKKNGKEIAHSRVMLDNFFNFEYKERKTAKEIAAVDKMEKECRDEANKCIDEIMLGGRVHALKLISDFERKYNK